MLPETESSPRSAPTTRLWLGIGIILFGLLAALDHVLPNQHDIFVKLWPLALVLLGLSRLSQRQPDRSLSGYVFILGGLFLLIGSFGGEHLAELTWPFFIVALGIFVVTRALSRHRNVPPELARHDSFLTATAILGGCKRRPAGATFKGGELTAIFGGFELDLRTAQLESPQVRVDVFILFGGGEIRVPQGWDVQMRATTVAGALEDKTLHLPAEPGVAEARPILVLTGLALFGGLTVSN